MPASNTDNATTRAMMTKDEMGRRIARDSLQSNLGQVQVRQLEASQRRFALPTVFPLIHDGCQRHHARVEEAPGLRTQQVHRLTRGHRVPARSRFQRLLLKLAVTSPFMTPHTLKTSFLVVSLRADDARWCWIGSIIALYGVTSLANGANAAAPVSLCLD